MIKKLLDYLDISDLSYDEISDGKWEIILTDVNDFTRINSVLTKDTDFMEVPDDELMSVDMVVTEYQSAEFNVTLEANLEKDIYTITIEELNND